MIAAVHAEWFYDLGMGAYTVALDGGIGEAFVIEEWVSGEQEAWVYATMQAILAAVEARPGVDPATLFVIGDRGDLSRLVRQPFSGKLQEAQRLVSERWPGVSYRCKSFADRVRLRTVLRHLAETTRAKEAATPTEIHA
jgi:hypothetical protein